MPDERDLITRGEDLRETLPPPKDENFPLLLGREFVIRFYRLLKGATLYERNNLLIERLIQECLQAANPFIKAEGHLTLKIIRENFFFNNHRVPVKADQYGLFKSFSQEMSKRWIGEIEFTEEVPAGMLGDFVFLLSRLGTDEGNYLWVNQQLELKGTKIISVGKLEYFREEEFPGAQNHKERSKTVYFRSIHLVKEITEGIKNQKTINIRRAKHLMQSAVNSIVQDDSALLGLATIKNYDEYTFNHSVNVAIYAIALGQRIGIPKKHLSDLGMAGLFHDIGKTKISREVINKTEKLSSEEWDLIRSHPVKGAEMIIRMKEWGELCTRMITGAFEHHLKYDLSGYPKLARKRSLTLFGRIIALADFYDALVRPRIYRRFPYVSEKILGLMLERAGKEFDPALVKIFINMIGIFPLGTLVLLNTDEMGVVVQIQEDPELIDRPKVCLIYYGDGVYRKGKIVDLREMDEEGNFKKSIVRTLDPNEYNLNLAEFVI